LLVRKIVINSFKIHKTKLVYDALTFKTSFLVCITAHNTTTPLHNVSGVLGHFGNEQTIHIISADEYHTFAVGSIFKMDICCLCSCLFILEIPHILWGAVRKTVQDNTGHIRSKVSATEFVSSLYCAYVR